MRSVFFSIFFIVFSTALKAQSVDVTFIKQQGKVGVVNNLEEVIIPPKYDALGWSDNSQKWVNEVLGYKFNDRWGLVSLKGNEITNANYTQLYPSSGDFIVAAKKGRYSSQDFLGLINSQGKEILPHRYNSIRVHQLRAIVGVKSGRAYTYGLVDMAGKTILPLKYREIRALGGLRYGAKDLNKDYYIFNDQGEQINKEPLDGITEFKNGYAKIYANHLVGLIDQQGAIISKPLFKDIKAVGGIQKLNFDHWQFISGREVKYSWKYDAVEIVDKSRYKVSANGHQWIVNEKNEPLTPTHFQQVTLAENGIYIFKHKNKWGALKENEIFLKPQYDSLIKNNGLFYALDGARWSLFDQYGIKKTDYRYDEIRAGANHYFAVRKGANWGYIDRTGQEVIPCVYQEVGEMIDGLVSVIFHGEYGIVNKTGDWVALPQSNPLKIINSEFYMTFDQHRSTLKSFEDGTIYFTENNIQIKEDHLLEYLEGGGLWKIDFNGRIVNRDIPQQRFQEIRPSSEGLFAVNFNDRYGFVDNQNRLIVANRYEDVGDFSEGKVAVRLLGKWGYIDRQENIIVQPIYHYTGEYHDGIAIVSNEDGFGLIDSDGKKVSSFGYDSIALQKSGNYLVYKGNKIGLLNKEGRLLINAKYDYLEVLSNGFVKVSLFGKYGVLEQNGVDSIPITYDQIFYDHRNDLYLARKKSTWEKLSE